MLEAADRDPSLVEKGALNFVIVGAGPTGAEIAGAFGDAARVPQKDRRFKNVAADQAQIILVDRSQVVLSTFSEKSQSYATSELMQRGVQLSLGISVKEVGPCHAFAVGRDEDQDSHCDLGWRPKSSRLVRQAGHFTRQRWPHRCATRPQP